MGKGKEKRPEGEGSIKERIKSCLRQLREVDPCHNTDIGYSPMFHPVSALTSFEF